MIHYQLRCSRAHAFDGWFRDSAGFEAQAAAGLVECPSCGDVKVARALMAPALAKRSRAAERTQAEEAAPVAAAAPLPEQAVAVAGPKMPDQVRAALQRIRAEVEQRCTYVGPRFADEARKMHRGESEAAGIYGETTPAESEALAEEGIEVGRIPWVPRADG
jgi:hypothetical protein